MPTRPRWRHLRRSRRRSATGSIFASPQGAYEGEGKAEPYRSNPVEPWLRIFRLIGY
ncbi:exported hypothetical protein [Mesorhizobium sp. ORS 3359]|nr:exported hypothetical protein [Mesorhizobium sp. ORS 3359]